MAYNTERSWDRKRFKFRDGVPENLSLFPSKDQFAILKANGYITSDASYDLKHTPDFDFCWLGPRYDLRELSIRSPLLRAQQQQQRKFATPKSRQKPAPQSTGQETTNSQAMLRIFKSIQTSQKRMFQQTIDALSARGQMPLPPQSQPQLQSQLQSQTSLSAFRRLERIERERMQPDERRLEQSQDRRVWHEDLRERLNR